MNNNKLDDFIGCTLKEHDIKIPNVNDTLKEFEKNINKKERIKMMSAKQMAMVATILLLVGSPMAMKKITFNNEGGAKPGIEENVQIPNPLKEFKSIEEAEKFSGFKIEKPSFMVEGYNQYIIIGIDNGKDGKFIRQRFQKDDLDIMFEKYNDSIESDGDFNVYEKDELLKLEGITVNIFKREDGTYKAKWNKNGFNYSLTGNSQVSKDELIKIIEGLKI